MGRTEGVAAAVFAAHPVERVTLSDKVPAPRRVFGDDEGDRAFWTADFPDIPSQEHHLPAILFDDPKFGGEIYDVLDARTRFFPTRDAALAALSAACVRYGRSLAGLPPLPPGQPNPAS